MKVNLNITFTFLLLCAIELHGFIIPDEIPSILSIIYSNIPTLKKGTDSRMGWGFRLGNRADFQIITELGPQINTQKLANQDENDGPNKRNTLNNLANTLYAQRQQEKKEKNKRPNKAENSTLNNNKSEENWLTNWSKNVAKKNVQEETNEKLKNIKPGLGIGEIDAKSVIPEDPDDKKAH